MKLKFLSLALLAAGGLATGAAVAAMPDAGTMLANTCQGCHGPGNSSTGPATPTIAGMQPDSLLEAMKGFKEGTRPATVMDRIAKGYTDDELKAMAAVIAKQTFVRYPQKVDEKKVAEGKKLHKEHCEKCHVDEGMKDEDGSSVLAGQWLPYLRFQMEDFLAGTREMAKKMKSQVEKAKEKGPDALDSLLQFYASKK
jgi:cytochrome subunit of sulfide dehydrogenase